MRTFFMMLFAISIFLFVIGLIVPSLVIRWGPHRTRRRSSLVYGVAAVLFALIGSATRQSPAALPQGSSTTKHTATKVAAVMVNAGSPGVKATNDANSLTSASGRVSSTNHTSPTSQSARVLSAQGTTNLISVVVSKNVDGDTIHVRMPNGADETIRMLLIDTPETVDPKEPVEPFGPQASSYAKEVLPVGRHIELEEGVPGYMRDKYGRLLAFVYVTPSDMYNEDVVKLGLARVAYIYPPNTAHLAELENDQAYAKARHLGIWSIPGYATADGYNLSIVSHRIQSSSTEHTTPKVVGSQNSAAHSSTGFGGLRIISSRLNVQDGGGASVTVQTKPGATGSIEVDYKSGPSHAKGLVAETANSAGDITWSWNVGTHTTPGKWLVIIRVGSQSITTYVNVA